VPSELLARVDPTAGDARSYAALAQGLAAAEEVVGFIGVQLLGPLAQPTGFSTGALDRFDAIHGFFQDLLCRERWRR
jgi:hypothetical protein